MGHTLAVVDVGAVNDDGEQQPERIDQNVSFTPFDTLAAIEAAWSADVARLDGLAVDDGQRRARVTTGSLSNETAQVVDNPGEHVARDPAPEVVIDGLPGRERVGEVSPLAARFREVEQRVEDVAGMMGGRASACELRGDSLPLSVRQVGAVAS